MSNNGWIEWVYSPEKQYPETLDTKVLVKFRDGEVLKTECSVSFWYSSFEPCEHRETYSNWQHDIVAYKVVDQ